MVSEVMRGFFVSRVVQASSPGEAVARAKAMVVDDWSQGIYFHFNVIPTLTVTDVRAVGFWSWLRPENTGYVFHPGK